jgi:hypothetical protein
MSYGSATNTAHFTFPAYQHGVLPDGNYRVTIAAGNVTDASMNSMGQTYTMDFYVLAGDVNRDRRVNNSDLLAISPYFGTTSGATFSMGDINYDGRVNNSDLLGISPNFGKSLPPP